MDFHIYYCSPWRVDSEIVRLVLGGTEKSVVAYFCNITNYKEEVGLKIIMLINRQQKLLD